MKQLFGALVASLALAAISIFGSETLLPKTATPSALAANIMMIKKRIENPMASKAELEKTFAETPKDMTSLLHTLKTLEEQKNRRDPAAIDKQLESLEADISAPVQGGPPPTPSAMITVNDAVDPSALDKIMRLNVPDSVRKQILKGYRQTGRLPTMLEASPTPSTTND